MVTTTLPSSPKVSQNGNNAQLGANIIFTPTVPLQASLHTAESDLRAVEARTRSTLPPGIDLKHWQEWTVASGVDAAIVEENVCTYARPKQIASLIGWKEYREKNNPGWFVRGIEWDTGKPAISTTIANAKGGTEHCKDGIAMPIGSEVAFGQFKPNKPIQPNSNPGKDPSKYLAPKLTLTRPIFLKVPHLESWRDLAVSPVRRFAITEGAKKAGAMMSEDVGLHTIALTGVWNGQKDKKLLATLQTFLNAREQLQELGLEMPYDDGEQSTELILAFDMDMYSNPKVLDALFHLTGEIKRALPSIHLKVMQWDKTHKGIDDLKVQAGAAAVRQAIDQSVPFTDFVESLPDELKPNQKGGKRNDKSKTKGNAGASTKVTAANRILEDFPVGRMRRLPSGDEDRRADGDVLREFLELKFKGKVYWDELELDYIIEPDEWGDTFTPDTFYLYLQERYYGAVFPPRICQDAVIRFAGKDSRSRVRDYLDRVSRDVAPIDITNLASRYLKADDPICDMLLALALIGAVARAYQPGCQVDNSLILVGEQGIGKSSFINVLGGEFYGCSMSSIGEQESIMQLHGSWIQEWAELGSILGRKTSEQIKHFLTIRRDDVKLPYARTVSKLKRQCVIWATTNPGEILRDDTGDRRFWMVKSGLKKGERIDLQGLKAERDAVWSAAVHLFRADMPWYLTPQEEDWANRLNEPFRQQSKWHDLIEEILEGKSFTTVLDLQNAFVTDFSQFKTVDQQEIVSTLKRLGWHKGNRCRVGDVRIYPWLPPENLTDMIDELIEWQGGGESSDEETRRRKQKREALNQWRSTVQKILAPSHLSHLSYPVLPPIKDIGQAETPVKIGVSSSCPTCPTLLEENTLLNTSDHPTIEEGSNTYMRTDGRMVGKDIAIGKLRSDGTDGTDGTELQNPDEPSFSPLSHPLQQKEGMGQHSNLDGEGLALLSHPVPPLKNDVSTDPQPSELSDKKSPENRNSPSVSDHPLPSNTPVRYIAPQQKTDPLARLKNLKDGQLRIHSFLPDGRVKCCIYSPDDAAGKSAIDDVTVSQSDLKRIS